jgi:hypothetical protein
MPGNGLESPEHFFMSTADPEKRDDRRPLPRPVTERARGAQIGMERHEDGGCRRGGVSIFAGPDRVGIRDIREHVAAAIRA